MPDGMGDFNDIFNWPDGTETGGVRSPGGSPRTRAGDSSQPGSPSCSMTGPDDHHSPFPCNGPSRVSSIFIKVFIWLIFVAVHTRYICCTYFYENLYLMCSRKL